MGGPVGLASKVHPAALTTRPGSCKVKTERRRKQDMLLQPPELPAAISPSAPEIQDLEKKKSNILHALSPVMQRQPYNEDGGLVVKSSAVHMNRLLQNFAMKTGDEEVTEDARGLGEGIERESEKQRKKKEEEQENDGRGDGETSSDLTRLRQPVSAGLQPSLSPPLFRLSRLGEDLPRGGKMEGEEDCAHMLLATSACGLDDRVQEI
ncbi:hypothetical protein EYF80_025704 [Liparis tanakae]|uniref:Uncharacterized protein n=1 Tax=Liparis tanakae TaxID=230148 RepID=A0A4Z2HEE2_9TELE|nr:hypothetical protein EYF80_025704 [Liparis tanakae]